MKINYKKSALGLGCLLFTACSTLSDLGLGDLSSLTSSVPSVPSVPSTEDITGNLNNSRISGAMDLAKAATLSNAEVIQYAKSFAVIKDNKNKVVPANSPYAIRLNKLVQKHIKEDGLNLNFKVYMSPQVNAFAMADGTVRVYSGLMDKMKDDELMFVIGHEIGHVKNEHSKSQLQKAYAANALLSTGAGEIKAVTGNSLAGTAGKIGIDQAEDILKDMADAQFSQSDEIEADDYGYNFTKKYKFAPDAGARALRKLAEVGKKDQSLVEGLFSSHPDPEDRAARLEEQLGITHSETEETDTHEIASLDSTEEIATEKSYKGQAEIRPATSTFRYAVQVEAATTRAKAEETLSNFEASGFKGEIQEAVVNDNMYCRVLIGTFKKFSEAKAAMMDIQNTGFSDGQPFVQKIEIK